MVLMVMKKNNMFDYPFVVRFSENYSRNKSTDEFLKNIFPKKP